MKDLLKDAFSFTKRNISDIICFIIAIFTISFLSIIIYNSMTVETIPCKYSVGDHVTTVTGDRMVVITTSPGRKYKDGSMFQPIYKLSAGVGLKLDLTRSGVKLTKTSYSIYEDQIKEKTP